MAHPLDAAIFQHADQVYRTLPRPSFVQATAIPITRLMLPMRNVDFLWLGLRL